MKCPIILQIWDKSIFTTNQLINQLTNQRYLYFDIRQSTFDICHAGVSFSIRLAAFQAGGWTETCLPSAA
jgi:hypothetical protein